MSAFRRLESREPPLFAAVKAGDITKIIELSYAEGSKINQLNRQRQNALQVVLQLKWPAQIGICELLIQLGIELNHRDSYGKTALNYVIGAYKQSIHSPKQTTYLLKICNKLIKAGTEIDPNSQAMLREHPQMVASLAKMD